MAGLGLVINLFMVVMFSVPHVCGAGFSSHGVLVFRESTRVIFRSVLKVRSNSNPNRILNSS